MRYTIKDLPAAERPRERLKDNGPAALSDAELLALILRSGTHGRHVLDLAQDLLATFDHAQLSNASLNELQRFDGIGEVKAGQVLAVFELCKRFNTDGAPATTITSYNEAVRHVRDRIGYAEEECLSMICLDARNCVLATHDALFRGSVTRVTVEPRVVVKHALRDNAAAVILAHNHPSGRTDPSDDDVTVTHELRDVLDAVDVTLLDHIIVGPDDSSSLKQAGHL